MFCDIRYHEPTRVDRYLCAKGERELLFYSIDHSLSRGRCTWFQLLVLCLRCPCVCVAGQVFSAYGEISKLLLQTNEESECDQRSNEREEHRRVCVSGMRTMVRDG